MKKMQKYFLILFLFVSACRNNQEWVQIRSAKPNKYYLEYITQEINGNVDTIYHLRMDYLDTPRINYYFGENLDLSLKSELVRDTSVEHRRFVLKLALIDLSSNSITFSGSFFLEYGNNNEVLFNHFVDFNRMNLFNTIVFRKCKKYGALKFKGINSTSDSLFVFLRDFNGS